MTKRVYKYENGEFIQTEGPLWEGPKETIEEMTKEKGIEELKGEYYPEGRKAPAVIIPAKHRSAG